ncbi:MAG: YggS family pyridoxal phosphate-dependent enzyme [Desulfurella sp.]|uniref:YggS family pyridoxal phosphate-dependent enzyme n=1 Tax=Desulfurella sp. TaxID=1962857 RepID=UPI000CB3C1DE|nr:YggS family pyridoxal phosphate-dependent enzyme [Desulfurella sp.]PMP93077.1 MAG: YggS family pyridoxal phosphate-dependent enzyme [Desulfurella sp.]
MENICENLKKIKQELEILNPNVKLMAVSKNFSYLAVKKAYECSQKIFGENRVQEAIEKIELAKADNLDIQWHLIGHLQLNKAKKAVSYFDYIDSVDSIELAEKLDKYAQAQNKIINIMLEINIANDPKKFGFSKNEVLDAAKRIVNFENLKLYGLMCIGPQAQESEIRKAFRDMKSIFEDLKKSICPTLSELSMGMSDDFRIAIQEGSTIIRIGRGVFGERT